MLKLWQHPRLIGVDVVHGSPPCLKLETWLRVTGIPYEAPGTWPPAVPPPKGKCPFVEDDGVVIGDSTLILEHLKATRKIDPDAALTPAERAIGTAFRRMMKEHFYWVLIHTRYRDEAGWEAWRLILTRQFRAAFGGNEGALQATLDRVRKSTVEQLLGHGMGRHSDAEIQELGIQDLTAVSVYLGDKPFMFGEAPNGIDATIYAYLASLLDVPLDSSSARFGRGRKNLVDYCVRMRERFFADMPRS